MTRPLGGGAATRADRARSRAVEAASASQLEDVRKAASRWQAGLAGLTGTIGIFGLIQGAGDVDELTTGWAIAYGLLLAAALACSVGGGVLAMRAAFGLPRVVGTRRLAPALADAQEARRSAGLLRATIRTTVASIALLAATLAVAWYGPAKGHSVRVHRTSGTEDCGEVVRVTRGTLVLDTGTGQRRMRLDELDGLGPTRSCSGGG